MAEQRKALDALRRREKLDSQMKKTGRVRGGGIGPGMRDKVNSAVNSLSGRDGTGSTKSTTLSPSRRREVRHGTGGNSSLDLSFPKSTGSSTIGARNRRRHNGQDPASNSGEDNGNRNRISFSAGINPLTGEGGRSGNNGVDSSLATRANRFARTQGSGRKYAGTDRAYDAGFVRGSHSEKIRNGMTTTVDGKPVTITDMDQYLVNTDRPTAGRGSFNVMPGLGPNAQERDQIRQNFNQMYQSQVDRAQRINNRVDYGNGRLANFLEGITNRRRAAAEENREVKRYESDNKVRQEQIKAQNKTVTVGEGERLFTPDGQLLAEGAPKEVKDQAFTEDVMQFFKNPPTDESGAPLPEYDKEKLADFTSMRGELGISGTADTRRLLSIWHEAEQNGVDYNHLLAVLRDPSWGPSFEAQYGYTPSL